MFYFPLPNKVNLKFTLYFIAILIWAISCFTYAKDNVSSIAWNKINNGALIIDVRSPQEFNQGHLTKAINIPHQQIISEISKLNLAKNTSILVYCRSGHRSGIANNALIRNGYTHTYNGGGYQLLMNTAHN